MSEAIQAPKPTTMPRAYLIAFAYDADGKMQVTTDMAHAQVLSSMGNVTGLLVHKDGHQINFPNDKIEKLFAFDPKNPLSMRYITIRKKTIYGAYEAYDAYLKDMIEDGKKRLELVVNSRKALHDLVSTDPTIASLKELSEEK